MLAQRLKKPFLKFFNFFFREEEGQAILEYVLTLAIIVSIITILSVGFKKSLYSLWEFYSRQISAACPGCPAEPSIRLR